MTLPSPHALEPAVGADPRVLRIDAGPDPHTAFRRLADLPWTLFLDSAAPDGVHGRYSYLTACPLEAIVAHENRWRAERPIGLRWGAVEHEPVARGEGDVFRLVDERLQPWRRAPLRDLPPFAGGAAGLFGYGLHRTIERVPPPRFDEFETPDLAVGLYDWVLAWDHAREDCTLVIHVLAGPAGERRAAEIESGVRERLGSSVECRRAPLRGRALAPSELAPSWPVESAPEVLSNFERRAYIDAVARCIDYVHAGDVFQVNLSQRLLHRLEEDPVSFYGRLRRANPAPFAGYFDLGEHVVASSSPEQFLALDASGEVITRPIKGTRTRGYTAEEDAWRRVDLSESEKDRAENVMIVDLLRNDLSRVCQPGSVVVPRLFELERHPTVHHLVSEVRGRLRDGVTALDLLRASFPGGSITGAPKVRAMEIIAELEPTARGPYCGSLAWIGFDGAMGSSILIRTVTLARGWMQLPVGGGIVADSSPVAEYRETLHKAAGMARAILPAAH